MEELVQQVLGEPAGLPLLQFTLYKLWENREGKDITWAAYKELGGSVRTILTRSADATYQSFKIDEDQRISRHIFQLLIQPSSGLDVLSRRERRSRLHLTGARDNVDRVLEGWVTAGLLRMTPAPKRDDDQFEVMHEALIRNWDTLLTWIDQKRVSRRKRVQLTSAAQRWVEHRRDPAGLLQGALLAEAQTYNDLAELETEFVNASKRAEERLNRRKKWQVRVASVFLVIATLLLVWAVLQTRVAIASREEARLAKEQEDIAMKQARNEREQIDQTLKVLGFEYDKKQDQINRATIELNDARQKIYSVETQARDAREKLKPLEKKLDDLRVEKMTLEEGAQKLRAPRPGILVYEGSFVEPPADWYGLTKYRRQINRVIASVGHVDLSTTNGTFSATGFVIAEGVMLIPHYFTSDEVSVEKSTISFGDDAKKPHNFALTELIGIDDELHFARARRKPFK